MSFRTISPQDVKDNYEYKVAKKVLLNKFPWIKSIDFKEDDVNRYSIIFLDFEIDPWELAKEYDVKTSWWTAKPSSISKFTTPFLNTFFDGDKIRDLSLQWEMEKTLESVAKSPAIPKEMKLLKSRSLGVGSFKIHPDSKPLPEYTATLSTD